MIRAAFRRTARRRRNASASANTSPAEAKIQRLRGVAADRDEPRFGALRDSCTLGRWAIATPSARMRRGRWTACKPEGAGRAVTWPCLVCSLRSSRSAAEPETGRFASATRGARAERTGGATCSALGSVTGDAAGVSAADGCTAVAAGSAAAGVA